MATDLRPELHEFSRIMPTGLRSATLRNLFFVWQPILFLSGLCCTAALEARTSPHPLPSHPGNIFLAGEDIVLNAPIATALGWQVINYEREPIATGNVTN